MIRVTSKTIKYTAGQKMGMLVLFVRERNWAPGKRDMEIVEQIVQAEQGPYWKQLGGL